MWLRVLRLELPLIKALGRASLTKGTDIHIAKLDGLSPCHFCFSVGQPILTLHLNKMSPSLLGIHKANQDSSLLQPTKSPYIFISLYFRPESLQAPPFNWSPHYLGPRAR